MSVELPAFYVGQTAKSAKERFDDHKRVYKANRLARDYGLRLWPDAPKQFKRIMENIPTREEAEDRELLIAEALRALGYGVWMN